MQTSSRRPDQSARTRSARHAHWGWPGDRLAIFDFDGTLADTFPWFVRVVDSVAEEFGLVRVGAAESQLLRSLHARDILARLKVPMWQVPRIASRMRQLKALEAHRLPLFPGVVDLLRELARRGVARAIASSDAESNVRLTLGPENAGLIDHYACGASLFGKTAKLRRVVQRFAVPPAKRSMSATSCATARRQRPPASTSPPWHGATARPRRYTRKAPTGFSPT